MTNQEIFDECYKHVVKQGSPGYDYVNRACVYDKDGVQCAIGGPLKARGLLKCDYMTEMVPTTPEEFSHRLGGKPSITQALAEWGVKPEQTRVAHDIQVAHDNAARLSQHDSCAFIPYFKENMQEVATKHRLLLNV